MDAFTFLKEYSRMCNSYVSEWNCNGCPRETEPTCEITDLGPEGIKKLINDVDQWSKKHPQRTRLQDFREKYPDALMKQGNCPKTCAKDLGYCKECPCVKGLICDCDECWNMPVEENE